MDTRESYNQLGKVYHEKRLKEEESAYKEATPEKTIRVKFPEIYADTKD